MRNEDKGLRIRLIVNTSCEEIFAKKCCAYPDLNMELRVANESEKEAAVPSALDLIGDGETLHIPNLMPHGAHRIPPGGSMHFYFSLDDHRLKAFHTVAVTDGEGRVHTSVLEPHWPETQDNPTFISV